MLMTLTQPSVILSLTFKIKRRLTLVLVVKKKDLANAREPLQYKANVKLKTFLERSTWQSNLLGNEVYVSKWPSSNLKVIL